jgi:hypothetical protein
MTSPNQVRQMVLQARIVWGAILMSQIGFGAIAIVFALGGGMNLSPDVVRILTFVTGGMLLFEVPVAYFIRNQVYKKNWQENVITPAGYMTGNIVLWAMLESVGIMGFMVTWLSGNVGLPIGFSGAAMLFMLINFPTGKPMLPATNPYQSSDMSSY